MPATDDGLHYVQVVREPCECCGGDCCAHAPEILCARVTYTCGGVDYEHEFEIALNGDPVNFPGAYWGQTEGPCGTVTVIIQCVVPLDSSEPEYWDVIQAAISEVMVVDPDSVSTDFVCDPPQINHQYTAVTVYRFPPGLPEVCCENVTVNLVVTECAA